MKKRTSNMSRRIVSLLMSIVLTLTLVTPAAFAEGMGTCVNDEDTTVTTPIGGEAEEAALELAAPQAAAGVATGDTDWTAYEVKEDAGVYKITTPEELAWLAQTVNAGKNDFKDKTVKLAKDIDLSEFCHDADEENSIEAISWTPIGNDAGHPFKGMFDGNGYTISGLYIPDAVYPGLLGLVHGTVQNLIVEGFVNGGAAEYTGGVVCDTDDTGTVRNCGFYGVVTPGTAQEPTAGGVLGGYGDAINCWYFCTDSAANTLAVCFGSATNCYHNVEMGDGSGTYVAADFAATVVEKLNGALATSDIPWKEVDGKDYPQLLAAGEKLVILKPLYGVSTAKVQLNGKDLQSGAISGETVTLTGENVFYRVGETGDWTKIGAEGAAVSLKDAGRMVTIYYASEDELNAPKWYEEHKEETTFTIKNASELAYLAQLVNTKTESFSGKTVVLGNDIDLSSVCHGADEANGIAAANWTPIGAYNSYRDNKPFDGTFDGKGHTIRGLYIQTSNNRQGLFGYVNGSVRNLIVTGTVDGGSANNVAGIAGSVSYSAKIENCGFYGSVISTSAYSAGGVVGGGGNSNTVTGCWYYYTGDQTDGSYALGVCGGTPGGYCYHNVNNNKVKTRGNYIPNDGFAAGVAVNLNVFAFQNSTSEKELCLWRSEDGTLHPEFDTAADRSKLTAVGLAKSVERSTVEGQAALRVNGAQVQSCLAEKGTALTLTLAEGYTGDAIYFTDEDASVRKLEDLKEIKADGTTTYTVPAGAGEAVTLYYGTYDEFGAQEGVNAWYYNNNNKDGSFFIQTEAELRFLAKLVNENGVDFKGCTITLQNDITLHGDWTPIGNTEAKPFRGTFHGAEIIEDWATFKKTVKPWVISGLRVTGGNPYAGLFGVVENGTIRYMNLKDGTVTGSDSVGSIVGWMKSGSLEECTSTVVVSGSENAVVGTLVGKNGGSVSRSYYYNMNCTAPLVGSGTTKNCYYLAATSSFGKENDDGARTETEFQYGRVTYDMGGQLWKVKSGAAYNEKQPRLDGADNIWKLQVAKRCDAQPEALLSLSGDGVLENDGVYYYYGKNDEVRTATVTGQIGMVLFNPSLRKDSDGSYALSVGYTYTWTVVDADTSWYENNTEKTYAFKNAAELKGFALLSNGKVGAAETFAGWRLSLAADEIDLSGYEWEPIGKSGTNRAFAGEFDGKNKLIKGMTITTYAQHVGLFGMVAGSIHNVQVEGSIDVTGTGTIYAGGIVAELRSNANVTNCLNRVNVKVTNNASGMTYVGGVVGQGSGKVSLCWNEGTVQGTGKVQVNVCVGGICGAGSATDCANFGTVEGCGKYTGGILGNGKAANSYDNGTVSATGGAVARGINGSEADNAAATTNSYYASRLNGEDVKLAYVSNGETAVTYNAENKTYTVGDDTTLLVDKLNQHRENGQPWFVNSTPRQGVAPVYLPRHARLWTGELDAACPFTLITVTYDPNGGVNENGSSDPVVVSEVVYSAGDDIVSVPCHTVMEADNEILGFRHENGTFDGWKDDGGNTVKPGTILELTEAVTLTAQWETIWEGTGAKDSPYQIPNTEKFKALQAQVNEKHFTYENCYFEITGNIDLANEEWTPIGNGKASFAGSIEGNGNTITGLYVTEETRAGLFRLLGVDGTSTYIRNLTISGSVTAEKGHAGGLTAIVGRGTITLENITTEVTVTSHGDKKDLPSGSAGGLIGYNVANDGATYNVVKVIKCINKGNISGVTAGGIAGANNDPNAASQYTLEDCTNEGSVTGLLNAGGILGGSVNSTAIRCENKGTVVATETTGTRGYAGGICATNLRWAERCVNTGAVSGKYAGGIAYGLSSTYGGEAKYCLNKGNITGTRIAAGIVAYGKKADIGGIGGIFFSYNLGEIKGSTDAYSYGIAQGGTIKNCFTYNEAKHVAISANNKLVTNSYYLASSKDEFSTAMGGEYATLADFASGKVAWGVDGGTAAHVNYWTQDTARGQNQMPAGPGRAYPKPIEDPNTEFSVYRALVQYGTGGTASLEANSHSSENQENAVYGMKGTSVTVTATPKDETFGLKSLTLDLMGTGSTTALESGDSFTLGEANALVVATFASTGNGGSGDGTGGNGGDGDGTGTDTGDGAGDENDEGLQDGLNLEVEYDVKGLVLAAYGAWGAEGSGKTFAQWLKDSPEVLRALITNSLDNMAVAAMGKKIDEARDLAALLLASLNEHSGLDGQSSDIIGKALRRYIESGTEAAFSAWLTTGGGMASGTYESIFAQYTNSLLALADRLYTNWESSGTALTFPQWLDAQQVTMESLSENAEEPDADTDDTQTTEAPEDVPDGQEAEGGASSGGNSVWEVIGTVVRENPIIVWAIVAVVAALVIVGAVRRYHKVKRDERDNVSSKK